MCAYLRTFSATQIEKGGVGNVHPPLFFTHIFNKDRRQRLFGDDEIRSGFCGNTLIGMWGFLIGN